MGLRLVSRQELAAREVSPIKVTRKLLCETQINSSIQLLFNNGSPLVIYLISHAALDVLEDVARSKKLRTIYQMMEDRIAPHHLSEWRKSIRKHYNFMKHADRDPEVVIDEFYPEAAWQKLFFSIASFQSVFKELSFEMYFYWVWFISRYPHWFLQNPEIDSIKAEIWKFELDDSLRSAAETYRDLISAGAKYRFERSMKAMPE
jgi:hypothetical protein